MHCHSYEHGKTTRSTLSLSGSPIIQSFLIYNYLDDIPLQLNSKQ